MLPFCSKGVTQTFHPPALAKTLVLPLPAEMQPMGKTHTCSGNLPSATLIDKKLYINLSLQQCEGHPTWCKGPFLPPPPRLALLLEADPQVLLTDLLSCATSWDLPPLCRRKLLPSALLEGRTKGSQVISLARGFTGCEHKNWR